MTTEDGVGWENYEYGKTKEKAYFSPKGGKEKKHHKNCKKEDWC